MSTQGAWDYFKSTFPRTQCVQYSKLQRRSLSVRMYTYVCVYACTQAGKEVKNLFTSYS